MCARRRRAVTLEKRNLTNTMSARWSGSSSIMINHVNSMYLWYDVMRMALHLCDFSFPPNP